MKRLLLTNLLLAFFTLLLQGQTFTVSDDNGVLSHDSVIVVLEEPDVEYIEKPLFITNISASEIAVLVKKEEIEILDGTMNTFCFNGQCYPPFIFQAPNPMVLQPGETTGDDGFYGDYYPYNNQGRSLIRYTFFNNDDPLDSLSVIVEYVTGFVGINDPLLLSQTAISRPYPNPSSSLISFDLDFPQHHSNVQLVIRNLLGSEVIRQKHGFNNGKLSIGVDGLKEGLYFYTFYQGKDQVIKTGKFAVKR
jgi:hypothetical protein